MGYHIYDYMVRVDQFKPNGKWYQTLSINMNNLYDHHCVHEALKIALQNDGRDVERWTYVCLEPYHKHSHPVMLKAKDLT